MNKVAASSQGVGVRGTGSALPNERVSSIAVDGIVGSRPGWVEERTGVKERRFAADHETNADFATLAASRALDSARISANDIDAVIVATSTADQPIPGVGARVQGRLKAGRALAFDVNAACAGFLVGCELGKDLLLANEKYARVLVVASDLYSRVTDPDDRRSYPLFGDGAGAVVLGRVRPGEGLRDSHQMTDGTLDYVQGGPGLRIGSGTAPTDDYYLKMEGRKVAELVRLEFPKLVAAALDEANLDVADIKYLICHQANPKLIAECAQAAGFEARQIVTTGDVVGNTGAASIPIGIDKVVREGKVAPGDVFLMITFGAGMSWGRCTMTWPASEQSAAI